MVKFGFIFIPSIISILVCYSSVILAKEKSDLNTKRHSLLPKNGRITQKWTNQMNGRRQRSASLPDVRHLQVENFPIDSRDLFEIDLTSVEQSRDHRIRIPSRDSSSNFQSSKETLSSGIKSSLDESESGHVGGHMGGHMGGHCYTSRDDQMMSTNHHRYPIDLYSEGEIGSKNGLAKFKEIIHASSLKRYFI